MKTIINIFTNKKVVLVIKIIVIIVFLLISLCSGDVDGALRAVTTLLLS